MLEFMVVVEFEEIGKSAEHHPMNSLHHHPTIVLTQQHTVRLYPNSRFQSSLPHPQYKIIYYHTPKTNCGIAEDKERKVVLEGERVRKLIAVHMEHKPEVERDNLWF